MTDVFENQPEPHRATSLPERQRAALTAIGPKNGKRAQQRRGALTAAQVGPIRLPKPGSPPASASATTRTLAPSFRCRTPLSGFS